jgi:hypothetical protein
MQASNGEAILAMLSVETVVGAQVETVCPDVSQLSSTSEYLQLVLFDESIDPRIFRFFMGTVVVLKG